MIKGQSTGQQRITGRIKAIAVDPNGTRIYAAAANGGVWYSGDGGAQWRSLGGLAATNRPEITRPANRNSCGAIHVEFGATASGDEVYALVVWLSSTFFLSTLIYMVQFPQVFTTNESIALNNSRL